MADEPVERMRAQRHQWSPDNRAHLPLACYIPRRQRQLQPLHTHTRYPLVTPSRKSAVPSPRAGAPPHPLSAPHRPVVRRRRTGGGVGGQGPIPSRAPKPASPTGLHSLHRAGKRREPGKDQPWDSEGAPRAERGPEAGGCSKLQDELKAGWRQPRRR